MLQNAPDLCNATEIHRRTKRSECSTGLKHNWNSPDYGIGTGCATPDDDDDDGGNPKTEPHKEDDYFWPLISAAIAAFLIILMIVFIVITLRRRKTMNSANPKIDKNNPHDIFLCYSDHDHEIVEGFMLDTLQNAGYKCIVST